MILIDFYRFSSILFFSSIEERGIPPYPKFILFLFKKKQNQKKILLSSIPFLHRKGLKLGFAETANPPVFWYRGTTRYLFLYMLRQPSVRQPTNKHGEPRRGESLRANLNEAWKSARMRDFQLPSQYRGRVQEGVDASFSSFLCAEEKDRMGLGYPQEESYLVSMQ